jgi:hypothetical protein
MYWRSITSSRRPQTDPARERRSIVLAANVWLTASSDIHLELTGSQLGLFFDIINRFA